jgi:hypothetical protein
LWLNRLSGCTTEKAHTALYNKCHTKASEYNSKNGNVGISVIRIGIKRGPCYKSSHRDKQDANQYLMERLSLHKE